MLIQTRKNLAYYIKILSNEQINRIPKGFSNNMIWNFGHCVVTQQLLMYKRSGLPMYVPDEMVLEFRRGTKPERSYSPEEVQNMLDISKKALIQFDADLKAGIFKEYMPYNTVFGAPINTIEDAMQFNLIHEGMHLGYMMALKNAV